MASQFDNITSSSFMLSSYWSQFHVNIFTGSRVINIFFHKWLTRNPKIENIEKSEFSLISRDWGKLGMSNLARMLLMKCYRMLQNVYYEIHYI